MKEWNFMSFIYADTVPRNNPDHETETLWMGSRRYERKSARGNVSKSASYVIYLPMKRHITSDSTGDDEVAAEYDKARATLTHYDLYTFNSYHWSSVTHLKGRT